MYNKKLFGFKNRDILPIFTQDKNIELFSLIEEELNNSPLPRDCYITNKKVHICDVANIAHEFMRINGLLANRGFNDFSSIYLRKRYLNILNCSVLRILIGLCLFEHINKNIIFIYVLKEEFYIKFIDHFNLLTTFVQFIKLLEDSKKIYVAEHNILKRITKNIYPFNLVFNHTIISDLDDIIVHLLYKRINKIRRTKLNYIMSYDKYYDFEWLYENKVKYNISNIYFIRYFFDKNIYQYNNICPLVLNTNINKININIQYLKCDNNLDKFYYLLNSINTNSIYTLYIKIDDIYKMFSKFNIKDKSF